MSNVPAAALAALATVANPGDDPHVPPATGPIGYAVSTGSILDVAVNYGSDGQGAPIAYELVLDGNNLHSGLTTTDGRDIHLFKEGNLVVGRYEVGGNNVPDGSADEPAAFAIYIDPATGQTTVVQYVSLFHPDDNDSDEEVDIDGGLLYVGVTVVDGDGDPLTDYVDIGSRIEFDDDAPAATFTLNSGLSIIHDETVGVDADANDVATNLSSLFSAVTNKGNDPHESIAPEPEIGYAQSTGPIVTVSNVNFGADGPGPNGGISYSLDIPGSSIASGLFTTEGLPITLFQVNSQVIVGRFDGPDGGTGVGTGDPAAFAIQVDPTTGVVTVVQYVSIKHDDRGDFDEANDNGTDTNDNQNPNDSPDPIQQWINNSALQIIATVTDGDGDELDSQAFNIGNKIIFQDDGPTAGPTTVDGKVCLTSGGAQGADPTDLLFMLPAGAGLTIDISDIINVADHQNSLGYYFADASGNPISGAILSDHAGNPDNEDVLVTIPAGSVPAGAALLGFFLIPDGNDVNPSLADGDPIIFNLVSGVWVASNAGGPLDSAQDRVLFSDRRLNPDDGDADTDPNDFETGTGVRDSNWEDVIDGDNDFNDVQFNVEVCATPNVLILDDEDQDPHILAGSPGIQGGPGDDGVGTSAAGSVNIDYGSDGPATTTNPLVIAAEVSVTNSLNANGGPLHVVWVDAEGNGVPELVSYEWVANPAGGGTLYGISDHFPDAADPVFSLVIDVNGNFTFDLNGPLAHPFTDNDSQNNGLDTEFEDNLSLAFNYTATDGDGDSVTGTITVNVDDDTPDPVGDTATAKEGSASQDINAVFVLDFSGSIDNPELNTMLTAVKAAAQEIFNNTSGDVQLHIVAFSSTATDFGPFNTYAAFEAQINAINGAGRPFAGGTDFTAAIEETMDEWTPLPGYNNQVFFISDGDPNEQTGTGGNSLADSTAADWQDFINDNDLTVTTVGVGNGIINARLQDVDLDGSGSPIAIADFDDLVDALVDVVAGPTSGNVLDNDNFGADGFGRITSITVTEADGTHVYTYVGNDILKDGAAWAPGNDTSILQVTDWSRHRRRLYVLLHRQRLARRRRLELSAADHRRSGRGCT